MSPSKVEKDAVRGYIIPVGGAEDKVGDVQILRRFVELAGGPAARVAVLPTASSLADTGTRYERLFRKLGAMRADVLPYSERKDADRDDWYEWLSSATGVFLTGGNQLRISSVLGGTRVAKMLRKLNARGVPVAGTSAGAAILCQHMIAMGGEGPTPRAHMAMLAPGLGLINQVVIDQHFRQRDRLGRLLAALAYNPFAIGIGLDEDTAAFIDGKDHLEVEGTGAITVVDASEASHTSIAEDEPGEPVCFTDVKVHILTRGAKYDLGRRRAKAPGGK